MLLLVSIELSLRASRKPIELRPSASNAPAKSWIMLWPRTASDTSRSGQIRSSVP